jgi:atypical dual specificity phosphatase
MSLHHFGIAYGDRVILSDVNLEVPQTGIVVLVGPTGTGKSTLLRTVAGFNGHIPALRTWGMATYRGAPVSTSNNPVLVSQNTRLLTATLLENLLYGTPEQFSATPEEKKSRALRNLRDVGLEQYQESLFQPVVELPLVVQRLVAIARASSIGPQLILIDEPTFGLEESDANAILRVVRQQASSRAVLVVLHNQLHVRFLGGTTALLSGGVIQEVQPTEEFFVTPRTLAAREYVHAGTCSDPSPAARIEDLDSGSVRRLRPVPPGTQIPSETLGPRGFVWLLPGQLAGTPQPGVVADIDHDLAALRRVGVNTLISLMAPPPDTAMLSRYEIAAHWFPIQDMGAPTLSAARDICATLDRLLHEKAVVAVHCRAGHGRTGTILVAYLIWRGRAAMDALETARRFEPKWVQSERQVRFLEEFASEIQSAPEQTPQVTIPTVRQA